MSMSLATKIPRELLRVDRVSLAQSLGSQYLLKEISFDVFAGSRIAIIGPSGAGKTSLLRLLNRLSEPTSGKLYLENLDYRKIPIIQLRRQVMLLHQEPKLLGMTVGEALAYPLVLQGMTAQAIRQQVGIWMEKVHIPQEWWDRTELQLSVGQRQLVAIARALVTQPKILLLDEPTSALDVGRTDYVLEVLTQLVGSVGDAEPAQRGEMAILMVTHQLNLAQQFSDRVLYMQDGQLLVNANSAEIDWGSLRSNLIQAEAEAAQEWS